MASITDTTYTIPASDDTPADVDASMLARYIYDTSSLQDRLIQGAAGPVIQSGIVKRPHAKSKQRKQKRTKAARL
ncbi:hypothetical protein ACJ41O_008494 [Fusarium nematophilum]